MNIDHFTPFLPSTVAYDAFDQKGRAHSHSELWKFGETDSKAFPLVAVGTALVAVGAAIGVTMPMIGLPILAIAVTIVLLPLTWVTERRTGKVQTGAALLAVVIGMMLSGGGAAWSALQNPVTGLTVAVWGFALCGVGGWRLILNRSE